LSPTAAPLFSHLGAAMETQSVVVNELRSLVSGLLYPQSFCSFRTTALILSRRAICSFSTWCGFWLGGCCDLEKSVKFAHQSPGMPALRVRVYRTRVRRERGQKRRLQTFFRPWCGAVIERFLILGQRILLHAIGKHTCGRACAISFDFGQGLVDDRLRNLAGH